MDKTIDRWTDSDGNGYAFKDTVARAQNRATIDKMNAETADRKTEVNTERKRIDNLIANGTAQTQEIGKTIVQTKLGSSNMNMDYLAADKYYSGLFDGITFKDTDFFYIPSESGSGADYVGKLLKPGLYHMKFRVKISKDGGLPEIAMRIILKKGSTTIGEYSELKTEYIIFPQTSSSTNMRNVEYIFAITEPTYIKLFVTSIADGTGTFGFNASECTITAIDWKGKQSANLSELHDLRIGADGVVHNTAGEAVRKQIGNLTEDKVDKPSVADNNKIPRAKNGGVEWVEVGQPTDEQTNNAVTSWLNNHPEVTTTVQNKSITSEKLSTDLYYKTFPFSVTPQMFGAKGDESDDTDAFIKMFDYVNIKKCKMLIPEGTYVITKDLPKLYKGFCLIGSNAGTSRNETTILDKRQSSKYLIDIDKELDGFLGGSIENIAFSTEGEYENFGIHCSSSWDAHIDNCAFWGYETALKLDGDEAKISNCQFIFCGSKTEKTTYNYGVVLENANEKRFDKCHFENSRFFVYILGSSWSNSFNNCKFETATLNSAINTSVPTIFLDSITSNYCTNFVNCDFHALDLEYYVSKAGISSYSDVPFMVKAGTNNELNITTCTFVCGPGSGAEMYNQFSQARFIEATFANIANCAFIKPSYIVPCVNVNHLNANGCCIVLDKNGDYSIGEYSENSPIINTEFGKLANISFRLLMSDVDKYYRICNKNFDFVTPRNGLFCRGNELYSNTIFIIIKAHNSNFAIPYEILISNGESGNLFGCIKGTFVSWSESIGNSNRYYNLQGTGTVTVYFIDDTLAIKLAGFNKSFGAFVNFKTIENLPIDWYTCIDYDVSKATKAIEITDPN